MVGNYSMIREIKEYAKKNNVPIMVDEGIDFLTTFFNLFDKILYFGTPVKI